MAFYIGVDLGGTNIAVGILDENGNIIEKDSVPTDLPRGFEEIFFDMSELISRLIKKCKISENEIMLIGVGSPGQPDCENGIVLYSNNLGFRNVNVKNELKKYFSVPVFLDNDANCAALGESVCGAAKGSNDSVAITLGTGIGGGIIINKQIYRGSFCCAGEVGHFVVNIDGKPCKCGRNGCWESYASATALIEMMKEKADKNSSIFKAVNGNIGNINAKLAFDLAHSGDELCKQILKVYFKNLAEGITNLINIFEPEVFVIGGGISKQGKYIIDPIKSIVEKIVYGGVLKTKIVCAELGNDAGIVGAAMLGKNLRGDFN